MFDMVFNPEWSTMKKLIWLKAFLLSGAATIIKTVTGTAPITLTNAISHAMVSLTQYGRVEQRNVPHGWTQVEYIESDGTAYIDLGYKGGENTKVEVEFSYPAASSATGAGRLFGSRSTSTTNAFALGTSSGTVASAGNSMFWCYDNQPFYALNNDATFSVDTWHSIVFSATEHKFDGTSYGSDYTPTEFTTPSNLMLFGFEHNGTFGNGRVRSRKLKLWDGATPLRDLVPVKNDTTSEYAMYDWVSDTFLHSAGEGAFTGGSAVTPSPATPMDIWCNNGKLAFGKPLTLNNTRYYAYLALDLVHWSYSNDSYSIVIPVTVGQKYRIKVDPTTPINGVQNVILRWGFVDAIPNGWTSDLTPSTVSVDAYNMVRSTPQDTQDVEVTATRPYMIVQMGASIFADNIANGRISVTEQIVYPVGTPETLTVTDADSNTQTATVQNLLAIPGTDYADTQEIINGPVGREVLVVVLDGVTAGRKLSEAWNSTYKRGNLSVSGMLQSASTVEDAMCTRFDYSADTYVVPTKDCFCTHNGVAFFTFIEDADVTSSADANAKLAAWYDEGKPAMLIVPLTTPTTETVTAQPLTTAQGTNTVSVVSEVDPVTLKAEYKGTE